LLKDEKTKDHIIISMHFEDYRYKEDPVAYVDVVNEYLLKGAKQGRFTFQNMGDYLSRRTEKPFVVDYEKS
ncbi:MAG: hypothetical protein AAF226_19435, partial [Verrucomicrobiota bacterium]